MKQSSIIALVRNTVSELSYKFGDGNWSHHDVEILLNALDCTYAGKICLYWPELMGDIRDMLLDATISSHGQDVFDLRSLADAQKAAIDLCDQYNVS